MVSAETLFNSPDWMITLTVNNNVSNKELGAVISQNNKPILFSSSRLSEPQCK